MAKLFELVAKNFKLLVRAKVSALIIFIGPLLLVSLLGLAYSQSSNFALSASIYSPGYTELTESLVTKMTNQNFRILRQESLEDCVGSLKRGESQACIVFPAGMSVVAGKTNEITFYVDYSQINLVWLMLDVMSARVSERSGELSKELTGDLLSRMWFIEEKLTAGQSVISAVKSNGDSVKSASSSTRSDFQMLDISVDFAGLGVSDSSDAAKNLSSILTSINKDMIALTNVTDPALERIEGAVASVKAAHNESDINTKMTSIDEAATDAAEAIDDAVVDVGLDASNASARVTEIIAAFDRISARLTETNAKIRGVSKQRDSLLTSFDNISSEIDGMVGSINSIQGSLAEALQKINEIKGKTAESISAPITTKIEPVTTQKTHFNSLFPTLLVLVIMITGVLLASTLIIVEKKSKAFLRNSFTPTSYFTFNLACYATSLIVIFIQLLLFVSVSVFFFETEVLASIGLILLLIFLAATVFICIGMFIGFLFRTEETATLAAITLATIMLLFSSAVIPLESLSGLLKQVAMFNPFVVAEMALRQAIIFQFSFAKTMYGIIVLASYAVGIFVLLVVAQNSLRRLSFTHFRKHHFGDKPLDKKAGVDAAKPEPKKPDINELAVKK
jgi:ABC-type multidrug transport system permease subunit